MSAVIARNRAGITSTTSETSTTSPVPERKAQKRNDNYLAEALAVFDKGTSDMV